MQQELRFRLAEKIDPERFERLIARAASEATRRFDVYRQLAGLTIPTDGSAAVEQKETP